MSVPYVCFTDSSSAPVGSCKGCISELGWDLGHGGGNRTNRRGCMMPVHRATWWSFPFSIFLFYLIYSEQTCNALILFLTQIFHPFRNAVCRGLTCSGWEYKRRQSTAETREGKAGDYSLITASHTKRKNEACIVYFYCFILTLPGEARVFAANELRLRSTVFRWCAKSLHPCSL